MSIKPQSIMAYIGQEISKQRKSLFLWIPVAIGMGIVSFFQFEMQVSWGLYLAILTILGFIIAKSVHIYSKSGQNHVLALVIFIISVTLFWVGIGLSQYRVHSLNTPMVEKDMFPTVIEGTIEKLVLLDGGKAKRIIMNDIVIDEFDKPLRVRLKTYHFKGDDWNVGDRASVKAKLLAPSGPVMPGGFDFSKKAYFERISAVGYTMGDAKLISRASNKKQHNGVQSLRDVIGKHLYNFMDARYAGVAQALLTGERAGIADDDAEALRVSGLAHLLAISGLHIGLVAGCVFFFVRLGLTCIPGVALHYPIKKWAAMCAIIVALIYMVLAGATVPTVRAFIMTSLVLTAVILDRSALNMRLVALAAIIVMVTTPEAVMGPSFVLSFAAVSALIVFYQGFGRQWLTNANSYRPLWRPIYYLAGIIVTSLIATLATAPFSVLFFNRFAVYSILSNIIAMPLMAFIVMPFGLLSTLLIPFNMDGHLWVIMEWGIAQVIIVAESITLYPYANLNLPSFGVIDTILICIGFLWIILWRGQLWMLGMPLIIIAFIIPHVGASRYIMIDEKMKSILIVDKSVDKPYQIGKMNRYLKSNRVGFHGYSPSVDINSYNYGDNVDLSMGYCDDAMCRLNLDGVNVTLLLNPIGLNLACKNATIVVSLIPIMSPYCDNIHVIDRFDVWRHGATTIKIKNGRYDIETVK